MLGKIKLIHSQSSTLNDNLSIVKRMASTARPAFASSLSDELVKVTASVKKLQTPAKDSKVLTHPHHRWTQLRTHLLSYHSWQTAMANGPGFSMTSISAFLLFYFLFFISGGKN